MRRTRIKICGVRDEGAAAAAAENGSDAVGLVFVPDSPRAVTPQQAQRIVTTLPPFVEPVGLFVDTPADQVRRVAEQVGLSTVQLHGHEPPQAVKELAPLRVIKAVAFDPTGDPGQLGPWLDLGEHLAGLLFDAPAQGADPTRPGGGSGRCVDWSVLSRLKQSGQWRGSVPLLLAGGLTPDNVANAIALVRPYAVDVSSGVESRRGVKDHALIAAFCRAARLADTGVS